MNMNVVLAPHVYREARRLDRADIDWWTRIDPDRINMISVLDCVLAQAFGAWKSMELNGVYINRNRPCYLDFGFLSSCVTAWRREINARRLKADAFTASVMAEARREHPADIVPAPRSRA